MTNKWIMHAMLHIKTALYIFSPLPYLVLQPCIGHLFKVNDQIRNDCFHQAFEEYIVNFEHLIQNPTANVTTIESRDPRSIHTCTTNDQQTTFTSDNICPKTKFNENSIRVQRLFLSCEKKNTIFFFGFKSIWSKMNYFSNEQLQHW